MHCYSCDGIALRPIMLAHDLPARQCGECGGLHLDLLNYRMWRDRRQLEASGRAQVDLVEAIDNKRALMCQRCHKLMQKFRISTGHDNYVDLCMFCDDVWLDHGEWELLEHLKLQKKLTHIMTEPWQISLRYEGPGEQAEENLQGLIGETEFDRLRSLADWLEGHDHQDQMLEYLRLRFPF